MSCDQSWRLCAACKALPKGLCWRHAPDPFPEETRQRLADQARRIEQLALKKAAALKERAWRLEHLASDKQNLLRLLNAEVTMHQPGTKLLFRKRSGSRMQEIVWEVVGLESGCSSYSCRPAVPGGPYTSASIPVSWAHDPERCAVVLDEVGPVPTQAEYEAIKRAVGPVPK